MTHGNSKKMTLLKERLGFLTFTIIAIALISSCSSSSNGSGPGNGAGSGQGNGAWLIPSNEVFDGGPGRDGIPALLSPEMISAAKATYLLEQDLVIGVRVGDVVRAYPHPILDWHEIINDKIGSTAFTVTYCPLTGTAIGWDRVLNGRETTFGVSGLLYNTNLMPFDRETGSVWSQMLLKSVNGERIGLEIETFQMIETTWKTFKELFPQTAVVSTNTGFSRPYGSFPYGDYKSNNNRLLFPVNVTDTRLPGKDRVVGLIVGAKSKVYPFRNFPDTIATINDVVNGMPVVVVSSKLKNFGMVFQRALSDGTELTFTPSQGSAPIVMTDNEGNSWDLFGRAVSGPRAGTELLPTTSYIAYWFSWSPFNPGAAIHGQ